MKRTLLFTMILTAAVAVYGYARPSGASVFSAAARNIAAANQSAAIEGDLDDTLPNATHEPMSLLLIGGGLMGFGLIGRRQPKQ
jgi:hypothetical protein